MTAAAQSTGRNASSWEGRIPQNRLWNDRATRDARGLGFSSVDGSVSVEVPSSFGGEVGMSTLGGDLNLGTVNGSVRLTRGA